MAQELKAAPEVQALLDTAKKAYDVRKFDEAGTLYEQALAKARELKDPKGEAEALRGRGTAYLRTGQPEKALEAYNQALQVLRASGNKLGEARALNSIGSVYSSTGQPEKALEAYNQARQVYRALKNNKGEATTLEKIASVYLDTGQSQKASEFYDQVLQVYRAMGDKKGEATALYNIGTAYFEKSQFQKALEFYEQALPLHQATGNKQGEAYTISAFGYTYRDLGQPQKALEFFNQALPLHQATGDKRQEATTLENIGFVYSRTGWPKKALEFFNQALPLYHALGDKRQEANVLNELGSVYSEMGQPQKALEFFNQALPLSRAMGNTKVEISALNNLGTVYFDMSQSQKALEFYEQALQLSRTMGDKQAEASLLTNISNVYMRTGQSEKGLAFYLQALPLHRANGDKQGEANTLHNIGGVYFKSDQPQKALEFFNQALRIRQAIGDKTGEAKALADIGTVYSDIGQPEKALELYDQALLLHRATGNKQDEANTLRVMARANLKLKRLLPAEENYRQAVALYETMRENLGGFSEAKSIFLGSHLSTYYGYLKLLLQQGKASAAFEIAQKTKARSLLDLMASGRVNLDNELTAEERQQERALRRKADVLNAQMVKEGVQNEVGSKARFAALKDQLKETESQLQTLTDTLYARHPGLAQKRAAKTVTLAEIAKLLPNDTALLDYIVLGKETLALFVVARGQVQAFTLPIIYTSLVSNAAAFRAACADPRKDVKPAAAALYKLLLAPAQKQLAGAKRLVICPDGALWDVPFQALLTGSQFLAQRYELAYAYSATGAQAALTGKLRRKSPNKTLLTLANPDFGSRQRFGDSDGLPGQRPIDSPSRPIDSPSRPIDSPSRPIDSPSRAFDSVSRGGKIAPLPGTQREADALAKLFPGTTVLTKTAAQETIAKQVASQYRYLHFATHGFFNDASPLLSSLVLAQPSPGSKDDGFLTAREIFDMDISAEMVVLSACNTARGVQRTGDGIIGLTWALFVAGCPTQVVSQWSVDDASTATLMTSFYENLVTKKLSKGAALRQASQKLMQDPKHTHPYYWAPFVLMGDWR